MLVVFLADTGYSQVVKIDNNFNLQLTPQMIEQGSVQLDISTLLFADETAAIKYFRSVENNLVTFTVDFSASIVTMNFHADRLGNHQWTFDQWNNYINSTTQQCAANYQTFSHQ